MQEASQRVAKKIKGKKKIKTPIYNNFLDREAITQGGNFPPPPSTSAQVVLRFPIAGDFIPQLGLSLAFILGKVVGRIQQGGNALDHFFSGTGIDQRIIGMLGII